jgi:hypothetical protein
MSLIKIDVNGKGNPCCSWSIDLEIGCRNQCVGCYGLKTSMMGQGYFNKIKEKEYDEVKFRSSCRLAYKKGVRFVRLGKHSDAGYGGVFEILKSVLSIAGEEGLRLIFVSKSLEYNEEIAKLLLKHGHILHMSLGMITQAPSHLDRVKTFIRYNINTYLKEANVSGYKAFMRIVADVTKPFDLSIPRVYTHPVYEKCIVTPMRFSSKEYANEYDADLSKYEFVNGYYRPKEMHESWNVFTHFCGEVNGELKCCKCLSEDK